MQKLKLENVIFPVIKKYEDHKQSSIAVKYLTH